MKGAAIKYTPEELDWIKTHCKHVRRKAHAAFCRKFRRYDVTLENYCGLCKRRGWLTGRTGGFKPGNVPANKGKKMPWNANRAKTQFKKGNLPHSTKWLGHERVSKDGYVEISIAQTNPHTGYERRHVLKHRHLWEKQNGPVPAGMCLKCLDGNRLNTAPSNWVAIPRSVLPRLNGRSKRAYDSAPDTLKPVILNVARLEDAVHRTRREDAPARREEK